MYEHDIFLSYRRSDDDWVRWTRENFARALKSLLRVRLGQVRVFIDESIETGSSWPNSLAMSLSRSKILLAVLSRDYFLSDWCRLELAVMQHREQLTNFRTSSNPSGLIIPVVIDDGNCFPTEVQAMQCEPLHQFANPFMRIDSPRQEALAEHIKEKLCPNIEHMLEHAPAFDPTWEEIVHDQFQDTFQKISMSQTTVPSIGFRSMP
jgi:hypothetical protein